MGEELEGLIMFCVWVIGSMTYARFASSKIVPGTARLLSLLPVLCLLPCLPFYFSSANLRTISAFFLAWLGLFKLLLLSFGLGPLHPSLPLPVFISTASLPIKLRDPAAKKPPPPSKNQLLLGLALKAAIFAILLPLVNRYKHRFHLYLLLSLYCCCVYLALEFILAAAAYLAKSLLGLDLDPQFDAPYRASSLQDFWGRRWNLMVSAILREAVYRPVRARRGPFAGVLVAFLVSGLMHEVMFYYLTSAGPSGEVTGFFLLHGVCVVLEVSAKRAIGPGRRLHPLLATPLTLGFVAVTGFWLFFPLILRTGTDERGAEEFLALMRFVGERGRSVMDGLRALLH